MENFFTGVRYIGLHYRHFVSPSQWRKESQSLLESDSHQKRLELEDKARADQEENARKEEHKQIKLANNKRPTPTS